MYKNPALAALLAAVWACVLLTAPVAQAEPIAYVVNSTTKRVTLLDTETNTVVGTIPLPGAGEPRRIAVNSPGTMVYVSRDQSTLVNVISTFSNTVVATVDTGFSTTGIAVNRAGSRVYVTQGVFAKVAVIETVGNTVIASIPVAQDPYDVVVHPQGHRLYVSHSNARVTVIDTQANAVMTSFVFPPTPPSGFALALELSRDGSRLYVTTGQGGGAVAVIDTATNTLRAVVPIGAISYDMSLSPDGSRLYAAISSPPSVKVIDARCNTLLATVTLPTNAFGIAVNPSGTRVYATGSASHNAYVINTSTNALIATVPVGPIGDSLHDIAFIPTADLVASVRVTGIEVTQGIQDLANTVPLLGSRRTFARVHVTTDGPAVPGVTARLSGSATFGQGAGLVTVPLAAISPITPRITVRSAPDRTILDDSFLFELPWQWTGYETLRVHATLSLNGATIASSCTGDVTGAQLLETRDYRELTVQYVRLAYRLPGNLNLDDALARVSSNEQLRSESWMRRTYPLSKLDSGPELEVFDSTLGERVVANPEFCSDLVPDGETANLCAYYYVVAALSRLQALTGFVGDADFTFGQIPKHPAGPFARGACCLRRFAAGSADDEDVASHELGHFLGRQHPVQGSGCGHTADDPNYPYAFSFITFPLADPNTSHFGFDGGDANLSLFMGAYAPRQAFDMMSYCQPGKWISDYTYRANRICIGALTAGGITPGCGTAGGNEIERASGGSNAPQPGDWLTVYGHVTADLQRAVLISSERIAQTFEVPPRPTGVYSIRLLNSGGGTLANYAFQPVRASDAAPGNNNTAETLSFGHVVPFVAGTRQIQILRNAQVLTTRPISAAAPVLGPVTVQSAPDPVTGIATVAWTASDPDGDALTYDVYVARTADAPLHPLMLGLRVPTTTLNTAGLGGGPVRFRIIASDGVNTAVANSALLTLANRPPRPRVLLPARSSRIMLGQSLNFEGEARDPRDGLLQGAAMVWSTPQGTLGTGPRISVATLPLGTHTVTLTATNSVGLSATRRVSVIVGPDPGIPGPTLTVGSGPLGWQVAAGETALQTATLALSNRGSGTLTFTAVSAAPWLTLSASSGSVPTTITLTANPSGFAEGSSTDTSISITGGSPAQTISVPVRLAVGNTFNVGNASKPIQLFLDGFEDGEL